MLGLLAATLVAAAGGGNKGLRVAAPDIAVTGMDAALAPVFTEYLGEQLEARGAEVMTEREIGTLLGLERQRQLLGCSGEADSCITELAGALGSEAVLVGDISRVGAVIQLNLKLLNAADARPLSSYQARVDSQDEIFPQLDLAAAALASGAAARLNRNLVPDQARLERTQRGQTRRTLRRYAWAPLVGGALLATTGGVALAMSNARYADLTDEDNRLTTADARTLRDSGKQLQMVAAVGLGAGAAALATGAVMLWLGQEPAPVSASVNATGSGAVFILSGSFE